MSFGESKEKILKNDINVITCLLDLELSEEYKGSVGMSELKKMDCNNKSRRISEIWNKLHDKESKGFKKIEYKNVMLQACIVFVAVINIKGKGLERNISVSVREKL